MEDKKLKGDIGEDFVNLLAYKSLLKYWCYPSPKDEKGDYKELCDLLVLFKDICIIISVKNYSFDGNYDKYNRKTITKAVKQISGAERKLFHFLRPIFVKHPERTEEEFVKSRYQKIFRIIVNLGEGLDMYTVADSTSNGEFISIFNKETIDAIFNNLDTVADFTDYLSVRENFLLLHKRMVWFGKEKDLLALYLLHGKKVPPEFLKTGNDLLMIDMEGEWEKFEKEQEATLAKKKELDNPSYFLDHIAEKELTKLVDGDLLAQEFLSLNRFERRIFANLFFDFYDIHNPKIVKSTAHRYVELDEYGIVFFYYSPDMVNTAFPEIALQTAIVGYSMQATSSKKKILGMGTTHNMEQIKFQFLNLENGLSEAVIRQAEFYIEQFGWFKNVTFSRRNEIEYPD